MKQKNLKIRIKPCLYFVLITLLISSCSKDEDEILEPESTLTTYQESVISYFKEIALGFEYSSTSEITRKWVTPMKIFAGGEKNEYLLSTLEDVVWGINNLATDGFSVETVQDSAESNCYIYFGSGSDYEKLFPDETENLGTNYALFNIWWNNNRIDKARIFIDTHRPTESQKKSLILEELTQTLGLGKDSPRYSNSIFYETSSNGGFATEYTQLDKDIIRLLYHPRMQIGIGASAVDFLLREILEEENGQPYLGMDTFFN